MKRRFASLTLAFLLAVVADRAGAAGSDCGPGATFDPKSAKCVCPTGKASVVEGGVAKCIALAAPAPKPPAFTPPLPAPAPTLSNPGGKCPEGMALVPGGTMTYTPRSVDKEVTVKVSDLCLEGTEVTVDAYAVCIAKGKCTEPAEKDEGDTCNWKDSKRGKLPANCVDWKQASDYCAFVGRRLPAENELHWAVHERSKQRWPWGKEDYKGRACASEWPDGASKVSKRTGTCPVGMFPAGASSEGVVDLVGNVEEWTEDKSVYQGGQFKKPKGWADSWYVTDGGNYGRYSSQTSEENSREGSTRGTYLGVRCAQTP